MEAVQTMKTHPHDQTDMTTLVMLEPQFSPPLNNAPISSQPELFKPTPAPSLVSPMSLLPPVMTANGVLPADTVQGRAGAAGEYSSGPAKSMEAMREMIFRIAVMQPITQIDPEAVKAPKRRNVKISKDPQSVAARQRRERISEKIRILQRMVPGGTKMDTASMLDEAVHYVKFLKKEVENLEQASALVNNIWPPPQMPPHSDVLGAGCLNYRSWGNSLHPSRIIG
ncbi:hypothetical protein Ancab_025985 [Ancistrocladus abbreviatus]